LPVRAASFGGDREEKQMGGSIVCGIDGSKDSRAAVNVAAQYANRLGSTLILVHVVDPAYVPYASAYPFGGMTGPMMVMEKAESEEEAAAKLLERIAVEAGLVHAERRVTIGHPAERLADLADEEDVDLIVVGSRGRGTLKAAFLGSVAHNLVGVARCPVLIVPPGVSEATEPTPMDGAQAAPRGTAERAA
jgi:nucleotide-binding universal stress UspA family protein